LYLLVCSAITFTGWDAAVASVALGVALAAIWSDLARLRSVPPASPQPTAPPLDSLSLFCAPVAGVRSRRAALAIALLLPAIAYLLIDAVSHFDWTFLLQKLTVLLVWLATFSAVYAVVAGRRPAPESEASPAAGIGGWRYATAPLVAFA